MLLGFQSQVLNAYIVPVVRVDVTKVIKLSVVLDTPNKDTPTIVRIRDSGIYQVWASK